MLFNGISILKVGNFFLTNGLRNSIGKEIKVLAIGGRDEQYIKVLQYCIEYIVTSKPAIKVDQTIGYLSWIIKFVQSDDDIFELYEGDYKGTGFVAGVETAIKVVDDQETECRRFGVASVFPNFSQMLVISAGVYEGLPLQAVRYPSPPHMCGWWITTDLYDGNIKSLITEHYYHVAFKRADILKYLALPSGYRFNLDQNGEFDVWYDEASAH